jgi:dTMP kinase
MASRGLLIVVEGLDRSGKTSQCQLLQQSLIHAGREAKYIKFPDRTTATGAMINSYLTQQTSQQDQAIHLIFSANRWEAVEGMLKLLADGVTFIVDRYSFSGAVYSAAKNKPDLTLDWAWYPEIGLPAPDMVFFLDINSEAAAKRGGYGEERYETEQMQGRVRELFGALFARLPDLNLHRVDASGSKEEVAKTVLSTVESALSQSTVPVVPSRLGELAR